MSAAILERISAGDGNAVRECIEAYGALVWSIARRLSRNPSDAEDATQEIFLDVWRCAHRFDSSRGSEIGFVVTIARRRLIDRMRKFNSGPEIVSFELTEHADAAPHHSPEAALDIEHARRALASLRPEYRRCLELALLEGWTHSEIAHQLQLPLGTVKSFIRRGMIEMKEAGIVSPPALSEKSVPATRRTYLPGFIRLRSAFVGVA